MRLLIGSNSRLAQDLLRIFPNEYVVVNGRFKNTEVFFSENHEIIFNKRISEVFYFPAITDPLQSGTEISEINFHRPKEIMEKLDDKVKFVTFGTVLENTNVKNNYVISKRQLANAMHASGNLHFQLNTLYNLDLELKSHMFLASLLDCALKGCEFKMSSGTQYREYHLYEEVACYIHHASHLLNGIVEVSNGKGFLLKSLAKAVFDEFRQTTNLKISNYTPPGEQYTRRSSTISEEFGAINGDLIQLVENIKGTDFGTRS